MSGYSLKVPHWGTSKEYPQHMFSLRNKKKYYVDTPILSEAMQHDSTSIQPMHQQCPFSPRCTDIHMLCALNSIALDKALFFFQLEFFLFFFFYFFFISPQKHMLWVLIRSAYLCFHGEIKTLNYNIPSLSCHGQITLSNTEEICQ